ncbi:hypothetical protein WICPIJ_007411 [Wickerhamomyces pijperi]|uniref:Uncharacterized protein n=1 Tax=Wickerhamomyces pijperi TaxID=599730 RepID=A0A9P8TKG3_WICPI|nr:hypothetical protein WICPIJ_007411 [Wickerhamomyces pijperi]
MSGKYFFKSLMTVSWDLMTMSVTLVVTKFSSWEPNRFVEVLVGDVVTLDEFTIFVVVGFVEFKGRVVYTLWLDVLVVSVVGTTHPVVGTVGFGAWQVIQFNVEVTDVQNIEGFSTVLNSGIGLILWWPPGR